MIDPNEPDPRAIYLRRRALAVVASVLGVVVLVWLIGGLIGSDGEEVQGAAAQVPASAPPSTVSSPPASSSTAPPTSSTAPSPTQPPAPPPDPNQPCPDTAIAVSAEVAAPSYVVGQRPKMSLVVVNAGAVPCTRDLGHELRELMITSPDGVTRIWSSNDCYSPKGAEPTILQPGERKQYDVSWAGRTSAPGCPAKRVVVQAGSYAVVPKLGAIAGQAVPLVLTPR